MTQANETALGRTLDRVLFWLTVAALTGGVLLLLAMPGRADSCAVRARPVVVAQAAAVVQPAAVVSHAHHAAAVLPVAVFQPIAVAVPTYTAAYTPAPAPAPAHASPAASDTRAILEAIKSLEARLANLEGKGGSRPSTPSPAPAPVPPMAPADPFNPAPAPAAASKPAAAATGKAPAVFAAKCVQCHARGKEDAGGGLVLLEVDGSAVKLDARAALATARRSYNGTMPPKSSKIPPLTDEEVSEIMAFVDVK